MDQSGPGNHVIAPSLIIDKWATRPVWARALDWILSAFMWLLYIYMIRTALIDVAWFGAEIWSWMFRGDGPPPVPEISGFLHTAGVYGIVIVLNTLILVIWARYNQIRFGELHQRKAVRLVTVEDLAELYCLPTEDVAQWQTSRILTMRHGADGSLLGVTAREAGIAEYNPKC
jgi:biofilm PGA synthesis protein PgaD